MKKELEGSSASDGPHSAVDSLLRPAQVCLNSFWHVLAWLKQRGGVSLQEYLASKSKEPGFPEVLRKHLANKHFQAEVKAPNVFVASNGAERAPHVTWQQNDVGPRDEIARILNGADCDQRSLQLPADSSDLRVTCAGCIKLMLMLSARRANC